MCLLNIAFFTACFIIEMMAETRIPGRQLVLDSHVLNVLLAKLALQGRQCRIVEDDVEETEEQSESCSKMRKCMLTLFVR